MESILERTEIPFSSEAEAAVLACCLLEGDLVDEAATSLVAEDFHELRHKNLFELLLKLRNDQKPIDTISVFQEAKDTLENGIRTLGGISYVSTLPDQVPSPLGLPAYVSTVLSKSKLRAMTNAANSILSIVGKKGDDADLLEEAQGHVMSLLTEDRESGVTPIADVISSAIGDIEDAFSNKGKIIGIPLGFHSLDRMTTGFKKGDMIVLAARPSQGKTSLAMNIAEHVSVDKGIPVGVFSLEMTSVALIKRMMASRANVNSHDLMSGYLERRDFDKLTKSSMEINKSPLHIDQTSALTVNQFLAKARHMKCKHGIKFLIVDYIQLMHAKADSRVQEVAKISGAIKSAAKELNVPVLALSQLSRRVEQDRDRSPRLSDLRDSGSIEQDADLVLLLHRTGEDDAVDVNLGKHRNGPCGTVQLDFVPSLTRFKNQRIA